MKLPVPRKPVHDTAWVLRWYQDKRDNPWWKIEPVPTNSKTYCALLGVGRFQVKAVTRGVNDRGGEITHQVAAKHIPVLEAIEDGRLIFTHENRGGRVGEVVEAFWLTKPETLPLPQPMLIDRKDYLYWAPCRCCGGRRYAVIDLNNKPHAACFHCLPPDQYPMFRAKPLKDRVSLDMVTRAHYRAKERLRA